MLVATYKGGTEKLVVASLLLVIAAVALGAVTDGLDKLAGIAASVFVACYVALLGGFAVLMVVPADGPRRVAAFVATVVCSDTGGYAVGVFLGKHPMAPSVSPKKSWEGFGGSAVACALCGGLLFPLTLHATWWQGVVFGLAIVVTATIGDLSESLIKRDLGIKDMGNVLPGPRRRDGSLRLAAAGGASCVGAAHSLRALAEVIQEPCPTSSRPVWGWV